MEFISIRDLRSRSAEVWNSLTEGQDLVVTSNGRPVAVLSAANASTVDATLNALRQARAQLAVVEMQRRAREAGLDQWGLEQVNAEIQAARRERRARE